MPLCFFFNEDIAKKYEKEREPFALVIGQKRKCDAQEIKFVLGLLWTLSEGNCRRFVYPILQQCCSSAPCKKYCTHTSIFPFEKEFPSLQCGMDFFKHAATKRLRLRFYFLNCLSFE